MITTRSRLISAGMSLIAERGYKGATVGDIETAAGLAPRRGALYKHFANKEELIRAGLQERIDEVKGFGRVVELLPLGDRRAELMLMGRWILRELEAETEIARIIEKEGDRFPELRQLMLDEIVTPGFEMASALAAAWATDADDPDAVAAVVLGSLVNHRRQTTLFGVPPLDVDEDRFLEAWVSATMLLLSADAPAPSTRNTARKTPVEEGTQ